METVKLVDVIRKGGARNSVVKAIRNGSVFLYPTDTVYGIGCDAGNAAAVRRISEAKGREAGKTFSVIAPSKEWIWEHSRMEKGSRDLADSLLPGPYTIIVKAAGSAPRSVVSGKGTMGVRMPKHPFTDVISESGVPFVTTSVNLSGGEPASRLEDVPAAVRKAADWAVDAGRLEGSPSRVFDLTGKDVSILRY